MRMGVVSPLPDPPTLPASGPVSQGSSTYVIAVDDEYTIRHNDSILEIAGIGGQFGVVGTDYVVAGANLVVNMVGEPVYSSPPPGGTDAGELDLLSNGALLFVPPANWTGVVSFRYAVSNPTPLDELPAGWVDVDNVGVVRINVTNVSPTAQSDFYETPHDTSLFIPTSIGLMSNDTDEDGDSLQISVGTGPAHGNLQIFDYGAFVYTPTAGYQGWDTFTYLVTDGIAETEASVSIFVSNTAPEAHDDSYSLLHDNGTLLITPDQGVTSNDFDGERELLTATKVDDVQHGTLEFNESGAFTYKPNSGFAGTDQFTYTVSDGAATSNVATVYINVLNSAPVVRSESFTMLHDARLSVTPDQSLLRNDFDRNYDPLTVELVSDVSHGSLFMQPSGTFDYVPDEGFIGIDSFQYRVSDGLTTSETVIVTIRVTDAIPTAANLSFSVNESRTLVVSRWEGLLTRNSDPDGDALDVVLVSPTQRGSLQINANGSFTYTPQAGFTGSDTFHYRLTDGVLTSNVATVTINTVAIANQTPLVSSDFYQIHQGETRVVSA